MRKALSILLSILILLSTAGISISRHYCGNILKDSSIFVHAEGCGDMEDMPMDCCHDETDHFEIQDDFQTTQFSFFLNADFEYFNEYKASFIENISEKKDTYHSFIDPPSPPLIRQKIYIRVQSFIV